VAGLTVRETGLVRTRSGTAIRVKAVIVFAIAAAMTFLIGYGIMIGAPGPWLEGFRADIWLFHSGVAASIALIVAGTLAERVRLVPTLLATVLLAGLIYPLAASFAWGTGWLFRSGFADIATSSPVRSP
jgi:Amt family ammonium transporter